MNFKLLILLSISSIFLISCDNTFSNNDDLTVPSNVDVKSISFADDFYLDYSLDKYTELNEDSSSYYITESGTYVITGSITSTITVEVNNEDAVRLVLNNVNIKSLDGPAILVLSADNVEISIVEGSENTLTDASNRDNSSDLDYTGSIYADCDLVLNGSGILNIKGNYNNGLITKDDLKLINLTLNVDSVDDGIIGKDSITIYDANITVTSVGDSLKSSHKNDSEKGYIYIYSGIINLESDDETIIAENKITIYGGEFILDSYGKAIKSKLEITIHNGTFTIDSTDDAIDSNTDLEINGGEININSIGDCIDVNGAALITGGTIILNGPKSYQSNSTFDIDYGYKVDGGIICAFGNSDLVTTPLSSSEQLSVSIETNSFYDSGTVVCLLDADFNIILYYSSENAFNNVIISTPELISGSSYTLVLDEDVTISFTINSNVTYLKD